MNNFKKYFVALFLLLPIFSFAMQNFKEDEFIPVGREKISLKKIEKKEAALLQKAKYNGRKKWKEESRKALENKKTLVKEKSEVVVISDTSNNQILYILKQDKAIPVEAFEYKRSAYFIANQCVTLKNVQIFDKDNKIVKRNVEKHDVKDLWNHSFSILVDDFLPYGIRRSDEYCCHQYAIPGAIELLRADGETEDILYGHFEYGVEEGSLKHRNFKINCENPVKDLSLDDCQKVYEHYFIDWTERHQKIDKRQQRKQDNSDNSEKE